MTFSWLDEFRGTEWQGRAELWLDPEGNDVDISESTLAVGDGVVSYTWIYEGEVKKGSFAFNGGGATWVDSWHQAEPAQCPHQKQSLAQYSMKSGDV